MKFLIITLIALGSNYAQAETCEALDSRIADLRYLVSTCQYHYTNPNFCENTEAKLRKAQAKRDNGNCTN